MNKDNIVATYDYYTPEQLEKEYRCKERYERRLHNHRRKEYLHDSIMQKLVALFLVAITIFATLIMRIPFNGEGGTGFIFIIAVILFVLPPVSYINDKVKEEDL